MKVLCVIGTRPEAIKMAPIVRRLKESHIEVSLLNTGQHSELLSPVLEDLTLVPDVDLKLMSKAGSMSELLSLVVAQCSRVFRVLKPDVVLVHGDTISALGAAQAAFLNDIIIGHVEAGLRSGNVLAPYPEEMNRILIDQLSTILFYPDAQSSVSCPPRKDQLGVVTGNTAIDAILQHRELAYLRPSEILGQIPLESKIILVTAHRRESIGQALKNICHAVRILAEKTLFSGMPPHIIFPVHLNPDVREIIEQELSGIWNVHLTSPLSYLQFLRVMDACDIVLTDSGGLQEEAPALSKPVLVLRDNTERLAAVEAGTVKVVGTATQAIVDWTKRLLTDSEAYMAMATAPNPYGDGQAAEIICQTLEALKR